MSERQIIVTRNRKTRFGIDYVTLNEVLARQPPLASYVLLYSGIGTYNDYPDVAAVALIRRSYTRTFFGHNSRIWHCHARGPIRDLVPLFLSYVEML